MTLEVKPCYEVVTQRAATSKAPDRAGVVLISGAMQDCLSEQDTTQESGDLTANDFEKPFMMLA